MMHVNVLAKFGTLKPLNYLLSFIIIYDENERPETFNLSVLGTMALIIILLLLLLNEC